MNTPNMLEAQKLLNHATKFNLSLNEYLLLIEESGQDIPEVDLDDCKELALVTKFSLAQICEAFVVVPPPEGWHY